MLFPVCSIVVVSMFPPWKKMSENEVIQSTLLLIRESELPRPLSKRTDEVTRRELLIDGYVLLLGLIAYHQLSCLNDESKEKEDENKIAFNQFSMPDRPKRFSCRNESRNNTYGPPYYATP
jgi:hypothetical protein